MARKRTLLNKAQLEELAGCYAQAKNEALQKRYKAVWLYGTGYPVAEIIRATGCSRTSLLLWSRKYRQAGPAGLRDQRQGGNSARLSKAQLEELRDRLHRQTPQAALGPNINGFQGQNWTIRTLQLAVKLWYHIEYSSRSSYHNLFARCGFRYQPQLNAYGPRNKLWKI